ncbi:MAG: hypothetical protein GY884_03625 [Proteobacteria bacterium]|nr:hypothetical protein [Pseudomonadota bacterium]
MSLLWQLVACLPPVIEYDTGPGIVESQPHSDSDSGPGQPVDNDSDGYTSDVDCDDDNAAVNPGREEIWYDGTDQDCDGNDMDQDLDGFASSRWDPSGDDCDDSDHNVNPDGVEVWYDGVDQDCNQTCDYDMDQDGEAIPLSATNGGAYENVTYDNDFDPCTGSEGDDCDDENASISSDADEIVDGVDNDCDGADDGEWSDMADHVAILGASSAGFGVELTVHDSDGDGKDDLFTSLPAYDGVFSGGGFLARFDSGVIGSRANSTVGLNEAGVSVSPGVANSALGTRLLAADLDGSGDVDIATTAPGSDVVWLLEGDSSTSTPDASIRSVYALDGDLDFATIEELLVIGSASGDGDQGVVFLIGGDLSSDQVLGSDYELKIADGDDQPDSLGAAVLVADANGDGVPDLLMGAPTDDVSKTDGGGVYLIDGTDLGTTTGVVDVTDFSRVSGDKAGWMFGQNLIDVGDFDGDGNGDIGVVSSEGTTTRLHLVEGGGSFFSKPATLIPARIEIDRTTGREWDLAAAADLDADGKSDVVIGNPDRSTAYVFLGSGLSDRSTSVSTDADAFVTGSSGFGAAVALGDVVGDEAWDLVVSNPDSGKIIVLPTGF